MYISNRRHKSAQCLLRENMSLFYQQSTFFKSAKILNIFVLDLNYVPFSFRRSIEVKFSLSNKGVTEFLL